MMYKPHFRPDPRLPGMGLGFFREEAGGHRVVGHDGRLPGFNAHLLVAPDDGIGLFALTNGSSQAMTWMPSELGRLLRELLDVPPDSLRRDLPQHPEVWDELSGRYRLPGRVSDLRGRLLMGGGAEIFVGPAGLMVRLRIPVPNFSRGFPLHPDDATDPYLFRLDLSEFGMPMVRVAFSREGGSEIATAHTDLQMLSLLKEPVASRRWSRVALAGAAISGVALALRVGRTRRR